MSNEKTTSEIFLMNKKHKILMLSDHPCCTSGVGVQARMLIQGLIQTGKYSFRCLGGAIKHSDYSIKVINPDFIIKPIDGFGNKDAIRQLLITEKPDCLLIFTDPRQFIWLWEMEDEIHQVCPIAYWHVWDNDPYPAFNKAWYESTDLINCLSYKTFDMIKPHFPEKTNYIPHAFPKNVYYPLPKEKVQELNKQNFGDKADWFKVLWVNRNAKRKLPSDMIESFKIFLDMLEKKEGHRKAILIMHTDPQDTEGPNLLVVSDLLGTAQNVFFSVGKIEFEAMNILHNMVDVAANAALAEGFGLTTLISLQVGKPIIALKTGGETRQVVDFRTGYEYGVGLNPVVRSLTGSQQVPYIYEDYYSKQEMADAIMKLYEMGEGGRDEIGKKAMEYVDFEFGYENVIKEWDVTLEACIQNWKAKKDLTTKRWDFISLGPQNTPIETPPKEEDFSQSKNTNNVPVLDTEDKILKG